MRLIALGYMLPPAMSDPLPDCVLGMTQNCIQSRDSNSRFWESREITFMFLLLTWGLNEPTVVDMPEK